MSSLKARLGKIGIWSLELRFGDPQESAAATAELDRLGFGAIWVPGGIDGGVLADVEKLHAVTEKAVICTGILNIWKHEPADVAAWWNGLSDDLKARTLLGMGVSHGPAIGDAYQKPLAKMRGFLDALEAAGLPLKDATCLAALGPKMIELSGARTQGAHPYLGTPEHTKAARDILGPDPLIAAEQGVILETDPAKARALAHDAMAFYRSLPNYQNNWRRLGFSEDDIANLSDKLIDALFAWGDLDAIRSRVKAHHDAGADHVCVQLITARDADMAEKRRQWTELAALIA